MKKVILLATLTALYGCGGSSGGGGSSSTNTFNEAYELLEESAPEYESSLYLTASKQESVFSPLAPTAGISLWDNATQTFSGVSSTSKNPQDFVGDLFDAEVDQSILERARMPFLISCCLDILAQKTGDLFTAGSQTITFTNEVVGVCGEEAEFTDMIGEDITIVVTNLSDTTNYDQMVFFDHTTNPLFSDSDQWMYVRNNSTSLNFAHIEDTSSGFDGSQISVNSLSLNKTTNAGIFQFATKYSTNDARIYRMSIDQAGDDVRAYAYKINSIGTSDTDVSINAASTFETQNYVALSMSYANQNAPYATDVNDLQACISTADGTIETDDTATCSANSKTVLATSGANTIETAVVSLNGSTIRTDAAAGNFADNLPTFTASTILSAGLQLY